MEVDAVRPRPGRVAAALAVCGIAVALAVLPGLVALGAALGPGRAVAAGLGGLVAVVGGVKVAAAAWGLAASVE